jgi:mannose-6-phosphate isomerase-like protein (cupin superfamily)
MSFFKWPDIIKDLEPGSTLPAGMSRQAIIIGDVMLALHEAFPNLKCKPHTHTSAQISYMLKGKLRMRIGNEERVISPGEMGYVPPNVEHSIESLDEYVLVLDIFSPPRPDIVQRLDELED